MAGELREWGDVDADELARILVLSQHLDDAVLGCGHLLAAHPGATVLTVFAGAPDRYPEPMTWWDRLSGFSTGALSHYRSQLRALEADWQLSAKLPAPEQYWRLAPPPEGWELLSQR